MAWIEFEDEFFNTDNIIKINTINGEKFDIIFVNKKLITIYGNTDKEIEDKRKELIMLIKKSERLT